jgi:hypothetical protein
MDKGTIFSGIGHAGLILWVVLGDWLFSRDPSEDVIVTQVSMMTSAEFDALQAASTPNPSVEPAPEPEPVVEPAPAPEPVVEPEPAPEPDPVVEPEPLPEPEPVVEPEPLPEPEAPVAEEAQPLPSPSIEENPTPEAAEIVAPDPVEEEVVAETADAPTPAVSEEVTEEPVVEQPPTEETVAEDSGDVLLTEANQDQTEATGMTTSPRPKVRPEKPVEEPVAEPLEEQVASAEPVEDPPEETAEQPVDDTATEDAIAALLDEAATEDTGSEPATADLPQGPPLSGGEMGDISNAISRKWNLGASSSDTLRTKVVIRVSFSPDGKPMGFELIESDGPTETAVNKLYETAQRAVNRAYSDGGLPLPEGKYDTWRVLDLVFDANGMALR